MGGRFAFAFFLLISTFLVNPSGRGQQPDSRPNIIFILADDLGYGDVQILNPDSRIPTPNINALAGQGISFTDAHATASVCTPSRYSFLTGRYSWRTERKMGVTWVWEGPMISLQTYTLPEMLRDAGYSTACIGKWHLGMDWPTTDGLPATLQNNGANIDYQRPIGNGPVSHGFDYYFGQEVPSFPPHAFIKNDRVDTLPTAYWQADGRGGIEGAMAPDWRYEDQMTILTDEALAYIREQAQSEDAPFFLYFSLSAPHTPIAPRVDFQSKTAVGRYGDFVFEMDHHIGRVVDLIDSLQLGANTLLIVTSDNGGVNQDGRPYAGPVGSLVERYGHNSCAPWRGIKSDAWEGGHRVPFIARWKGKIPENLVSDKLISQVDMMATFAAAADGKVPDDAGEDSFNVLPLLLDSDAVNPRQYMVARSGNGVLSLRDAEWKLILSSGGGGSWTEPKGALPELVAGTGDRSWKNIQLYNLSIDPDEGINLAASQPERVADMMRTLKSYFDKGRSTPGTALAKLPVWEQTAWADDVE